MSTMSNQEIAYIKRTITISEVKGHEYFLRRSCLPRTENRHAARNEHCAQEWRKAPTPKVKEAEDTFHAHVDDLVAEENQ